MTRRSTAKIKHVIPSISEVSACGELCCKTPSLNEGKYVLGLDTIIQDVCKKVYEQSEQDRDAAHMHTTITDLK